LTTLLFWRLMAGMNTNPRTDAGFAFVVAEMKPSLVPSRVDNTPTNTVVIPSNLQKNTHGRMKL
jgi:hypothetical protein